MMRFLVQRTALVLGAAVGLLGTRPATANAQKALVYCPVGIDATGCNAIVNALTGPAYPLGVDRGYDGTGGTVDLKTVDLFTYSVFVVPSLADGSTSQPYAVLRDAEVAEHLKAALIGRLAMWSGSPDQGATNRAMKDALIQNLAGWASASFGAAKGPGLVALLDASASPTSRYDWVRAITPVPVTSDPALLIYSAVRALDARATSILTSGAGPIAYDNMATFGFQVPNGAAGVSLDAVGQTGTTQGGQVVLLTMDAGNASGATVQTDKDDYPPGTTVFITGAGWQPGEAVTLTLHHDPIRDADTELTATADAEGKIANSDFAPGDYDIDVRFVLTAIGQGSGRRAQTTFTDGQPQTVTLTPSSVSVVPGISAVYTTDVTMGGNGTACTVTLEVTTALPTGASASFNSNPVNATNVNFSRTLTISTTNSGPPAGRTPPGTYPFTVRATRGANCQSSGNGPTTNGTLVVTGNTNTNTALTSSLNPSTYGQSVTFTATVTGTTNPQCGTVAFKDGATTINTATLSGTNVATFNTSTLSVGSHTITAEYTPAASGCAFNASASNAVSQTVNTRPITVTADAKAKVYGAADPALTFQVTSGSLVPGDNVTGSLSRAAGENVGTYAIQQGTVTAGANYTITYVGANLTITPRALTITADAKTKVYGNTDPPLTYVVSGGPLVGTDVVTGALTRIAGENVGTYAIQQGTVTAGANYTITYVGADLTITGRPLTVTADPQTKVYGDADPAFTYQLTGTLVTGDAFTGALSRTVGENVGTYALQLGTLSAGTNYAITFVPANLTINVRPIAVTADAKPKVYGNADPAFTYQVTTGSLAFTDTFTGALARAAGEAVGTYAITQGTLSAGPNYNLTFNGANLTITVRPITVTADAKSKVYGDADPALTYQITAGSLAFADAFTGTLSRAAGENVGSYAITQGTLALTANYALTYNGANLTISARPITITADAKSKIYGDADPAFTYQLTSGTLVSGDGFTGSLTRVAGESVGTYTLQQGTVTAGTNYTITFISANLTITQRPITVTADAKSKVYGVADPAFTYQVTAGNLVSGDAFSGALARAAGENVGTYAITQGTLTAGANYALTYGGADLTITTRPVTVTADAKTKVFGDNDPALTYQITSGSLAFSDGFSGALTRAPGSNVGTYAILQGTLALSSNYALTFVGADLTITPRPITVTADAKSKTYGDADPALTYQVTVGTLVDEADLTGALARAPGESVGSYAITQGTLAATTNYTLSFSGANLTITKRPITITADPKTKVYGNADPAFTYQITSGTLVFSDAFTGALTRASGENVGTYAILQGGVTAGGNYDVTYVGADLTITQRPITVTANPQTKTYGDADPAFTYAVTTGSLAFSDAFSGTLDRDAGENVGTYAIKQGTLTAGGNYLLTFAGANLTITKRAVTITADAKTKVYGNADPALTFQITTGSLAFTDAFAGALTRVAGENVGSFAIQQGTVALSANYDLTYVGANFSITPRAIAVTADPQTKVYGEADPTLTYQITSGTLVGTDAFSGGLTRVAGENVGSYAINQGTLALSTNYALTYFGANLSITQRPITITADAKSKVYGNADPAFTYQITSGNLVFGNTFSGSLTRAAGENVGTYAIQVGTVTAGGNYNVTYVGADLTITARPITVTADPQTKVYGTADPTLSYQLTSGSLAFTDVFSGALARVAGEDVGTYAIDQGTLTAGTNYTLSFVGASLTITKRPVTITADAKTKTYGDADPALTFQITTGTLAFTDAFAGSLVRAAGENVGPYAINQGSVALSSNYTLTFVAGVFSITQRSITITADPKNKTYGDGDPALTYQLTSGTLVSGDGFTGSLTRAAGENVGTYAIQQGTVTAGGNYNLAYVGADLTITQRAVTITADAKSKVYGDADPALTYQITSGNLAFSDAFTGSLTRAAGENVGTHAIQQGTVTAGTNYNLTYVAADLTITARPITITADAKSKTYGNTDPALTYQITSGALQFSDAFGGALSRAPGETVGPYAIQQGTVALSTNYTLTYVGANLTIIKRLATWTTLPAARVFGTADPAPLTTGSGTNFVASDGVTATYSRAVGESVPGPYLITATLSSTALGALDNYTITNVGANFTITQATPTIAWTGMDATINQGTALTAGILNAVAQPVVGSTPVAGTMAYTLMPSTPVTAGTTVYGVGNYNVLATFTATDPNYTNQTLTKVLTVNNQAPVVTLITLPMTAVAMGSATNLTARFTDAGLTDTHTYSIDWDWDLLTNAKTPGSVTTTWAAVNTDLSVANPLGTINTSYVYPAAGVYTVRVTVKDNNGLTGARTSQNEVFAYIVVYDASGGFVTGGGWINSPANACLLTTACVGATGKANFGFVAKYKKGQTAPDGNTEFQFQAGNLNFSSTVYEWLVVAGTKAQYKGRGTINGSGNYGFLLTAVDGDTKGSPDTFRMKIWIINSNGTTTVVYDNQMGAADDGTPTMVLGGGSIQIHDK